MISRTTVAVVDAWTPVTHDPILGDVSRTGTYAPFKQDIQLYNFLDRDVIICSREGIRFKLKRRNRETGFKGILVRHSYHFTDQDISRDIEKDFNGTYEQYSPALQAIKKMWSRMDADKTAPYMPNRKHNAYVEYKYSQEVIDEHNGSLLLSEVDLMLFYADRHRDFRDDHVHPDSAVGQIRKVGFDLVSKIKANPASEGANFIFSIKIIDNSGNYGSRWFRLGDFVYRIDPIADNGSADGVYIYRHEPVRNRESSDTPKVADRFELEDEIPYIRLHKSYEEARHEGRSKEALQLEIAEKELQAKLQLSQNSLAKAESDKELAEVSLRQAREKHEHEKLRFEHEKQVLQDTIAQQAREFEFEKEKLKVEKNMLFRKAIVDIFKSVPMLITGGIALLAALMKIFRPAAVK